MSVRSFAAARLASRRIEARLGERAYARERGSAYAVETVTMLAIFSGVGMRDPLLEPLMQKALTTGGLLKLKGFR